MFIPAKNHLGLKPKVQKDVFGLEDIDKINQKPEICRTLLKCKLCEFSSKGKLYFMIILFN